MLVFSTQAMSRHSAKRSQFEDLDLTRLMEFAVIGIDSGNKYLTQRSDLNGED
jgi:hypothetical protein